GEGEEVVERDGQGERGEGAVGLPLSVAQDDRRADGERDQRREQRREGLDVHSLSENVPCHHMSDPRAQLPKVDDVLRRPEIAGAGLPRWAVLEAVRAEIAARRNELRDGGDPQVASEAVLARARALARPSLRRVINATGVVLHTNLGR